MHPTDIIYQITTTCCNLLTNTVTHYYIYQLLFYFYRKKVTVNRIISILRYRSQETGDKSPIAESHESEEYVRCIFFLNSQRQKSFKLKQKPEKDTYKRHLKEVEIKDSLIQKNNLKPRVNGRSLERSNGKSLK